MNRRLLLQLFLFAIGLSVGTLSVLCLRSFPSAAIPSFSFYISFLPSTSTSDDSSSTLFLRPPPPSSSPLLETPAPAAEAEADSGLMHDMSDDELLERASSVDGSNATSYRVAFMFLTPGPLPLAPLWERFFQGHNGLYSVYVHPHPSYNDSPVPPDSAFYGRRIPSQPVYWGTTSMVDAERRLLANALLDPSNQRFVLLSQSCIPLFNFTTIYNYLKGSNQSFIGTYRKHVGRRRYNPRMRPNVTVEQWRKGSQWFEARRDLAVKIVSDQTYYPLFNNFCRNPCYSDEHYLQTMVNILYPELSSNRSVTWVDWSRGGAHPRKYEQNDVEPDLLNRIRFGSECLYNGNTTNVCSLFARKFMPTSLDPLLEVANSLLGF